MDVTVFINACMRELGITSDRKFCRLTGISNGLITKWNNSECIPSTESLKKIAIATGKNISMLIDHDPDADIQLSIFDASLSIVQSERIRYVRVYKSEEIRNDAFICQEAASSKDPDSLNSDTKPDRKDYGCIEPDHEDSDHDMDEYDRIVLPDKYEAQDEFFAFSVPDNNMAPELFSGDTVIVHRQDDADDGDTVIACIGQDSAVCSILLHMNEGIILHSPTRNPGPAFFNYVSIRDLPVRIIGKVVDIYHRDYK